MERIEVRYTLFNQALTTLEIALSKFKAVNEDHFYYQELRDSVIQRFEYSIDSFWKLLKEYLEVYHGIDPLGSPKTIIKICFDVYLITSDEYISK